MITIRDLTNVSVNEILETFNISFSDYIVPLQLTKEQLENKIRSEKINPGFSAGVFENERMIAFILHGYDVINGRKTLYNAGTGVVPEKRGCRYTAKLYDFLRPIFHEKNIERIVLEVITQNTPAIKTYEKSGFAIARKLNCYKGSLRLNEKTVPASEVKILQDYDWETLRSFWDWQPTWQNSMATLAASKQSNVLLGNYIYGKLCGYAILNPATKRILQFAVLPAHRNKGVANNLFHHIRTNYGSDITLTNIDEKSRATSGFLLSMGLTNFIDQFEMELVL